MVGYLVAGGVFVFVLALVYFGDREEKPPMKAKSKTLDR